MAAPMRDSPLDGGHRAKVADPRTAAKAEPATSNFEYDDNEWDIGIGDLIIDLDADIEKTNEKSGGAGGVAAGGGGSANCAGGMASAANGGKSGKMAVEHSATVDKGLKMKIKRTKPGTKTSEAKHEIVKPGEQNGGEVSAVDGVKGKHPLPAGGGGGLAGGSATTNNGAGGGGSGGGGGGGASGSKRGSSGHRRDKARDKHGGDKVGMVAVKPPSSPASAPPPPQTVTSATPEMNGVVRTAVVPNSVAPVLNQTVTQPQQPAPQQQQTPTQQVTQQPQQQQQRLFPVSSGPGPPNAPGPPPATPPAPKMEPTKTVAATVSPPLVGPPDERSSSPPPKKIKIEPNNKIEPNKFEPNNKFEPKINIEPKDMLDVCVGTSVGTITEPDCLGPCEPGTSVTLEGIVWHETEGGKTYVGTLLDCTKHDWAPPRFCDSPTSDLDARLPKGRGKRGRAATNSNPGGDLSNFTETRSSVHSKLRNGGAKGRRGGATGGSSSSSSGSTTTAGTGSPTPFVPPRPEPNNKRKGRSPDEEPLANMKKNRVAPASASNSPPSSPVLLECPEPNCSKKYKHINGLKYHQSHAHGTADDEDTKDEVSMSENDESNVEAPSPATPVKSPEKVQEPLQVQSQQRKEDGSTLQVPPLQSQQQPQCQAPLVLTPPIMQPETPTQPTTPNPTTPPQPSPTVQLQTPVLPIPPSPADMVSSGPPPPPNPDPKNVVKPGVLRYGPPVEDFSVGSGMFKQVMPPTVTVASIITSSIAPVSTIRAVSVAMAPSQPPPQPQQVSPPSPAPPPVQPLPLPLAQIPQTIKPVGPPPQFKVKPTAALMPDDKKDRLNKSSAGHKKKSRKSPAGSPHPQPEQPTFGLDPASREDVQSPAYSDISDDAAPVLESEVGDGKGKPPGPDKKGEVGQGPSQHAMPHYGMYPFYSQPPYLVPSVQHDGKPKENCEKLPGEVKTGEKEKKESGEYQQKLLQQHYYPYGYMPGYPYNLEPSYPITVMPSEEKAKEPHNKEDKSPSPMDQHVKPALPIPSPIQVPNPGKIKTEPSLSLKEKHQNENHQIMKESMDMKSQMNPYIYSRQQQQQQQQEDLRRYYLYPEQQRRKEPQMCPGESIQKPLPLPSKPTLPSPSHKHKEKPHEEKKEEKIKQEGVKPTMETQGPPPPPTSQYAYIHPSYMQSPHYGALPFDPGHPMYRSINPMLVPGPYGANPYLHPQLPRYHAPEDLSRPPSGPTKALDLLQHHASQYYSNHKIHELQERALKSPTPKTAAAVVSPSGIPGNPQPAPGSGQGGPQGLIANNSGIPGAQPPPGKQQQSALVGEGKEARSPPPQRHVHTHHHTHVGLGYPILTGQYPAPYGGKPPLVRP
uniref:C2H2-type domain-containing protein n=1 Tax=Timema shepardi TaxID=629360 RepID=A0A7R9AUL4_TIMSH|nr:unnamed protein product [Timema shepardi]